MSVSYQGADGVWYTTSGTAGNPQGQAPANARNISYGSRASFGGQNQGQNRQITSSFSANGINLGNLRSTGHGFVDTLTGQIYSNQQVIDATATFMAHGLYNSGQTVDPDQFKLVDYKDFMNQAGKVLDPYYSSKFKSIAGTLSTKLSDLASDLEKKKEALTEASNTATRTGQNTLAERGLTFSGTRNTFDETQARDLRNSLNTADTDAFRAGQELVSNAENLVGSAGLSGINRTLGSRQLQIGNPYGYANRTNLVGDYNYQRGNAENTLARSLASDENQRRQYAWNLNHTSF